MALVGPKAIIHIDALKQNYRQVKSRINGKPVMAVVKANGYGHGSVECAKALEAEGVDFFAVFTIEEARELREAGVNGSIFLFSRFIPEIIQEAVDKDFVLNLSLREDLDEFINFYRKTGVSPRIHIKIDTGMSRLGIDVEDAETVFNALKEYPGLNVEGIYSHYATADEGDLSYAMVQFNKFNSLLKLADSMGLTFKFVHFSNSGTVLNIPESYFDIVRVGMLLYGAYPSDEVPMDLDIRPVMEFTGPIVTVRRVKVGTFVSYGGKYKTEQDTNLAVIQTGFADGFPRPWFKNGFVAYKGKQYPIAGRVCMDQLMVDFGNTVPEVGDDVLFWGENSHGRITMEEVSEAIESTPYVLATGIHGRTERVYLK